MPEQRKPPGGEEPREPYKANWGDTFSQLARLTGVGWYVAASIALGTLGGVWLDSRLDTEPWLMVAGLVLGVLVAITGMLRMLGAVSGPRKRTGPGQRRGGNKDGG